MILAAAILISAVCFIGTVYAETPTYPSLGSITTCTVDDNSNLVVIQGSIKHSVLIGNRDSKIAVYRFDPWTDVASALSEAEPYALSDMSISFNFKLPGATLLHRTSLYAVALISPEGTATLISAPTYPDATTTDTSAAGFKAILTSDHASSLTVLPGSAIVDVYLDKLNNGNNSGYIFNADGDLFYFDKAVVNGLDQIIRSYTAAGTDVYMRFLISPYVTYLPFCSDAVTWATNKCIAVDDEASLNAIYAYTSFLISRYNGGDYGRVDGIILGRGADKPILYNYASPVSEDYNTVYARSLAVIGLAASAAAGSGISLIVPISDTLTPNGRVNGEEFLYSIADYIETYSNLTFTVMCESRHNPYHITDGMFASEIEPETTVDETENTASLDDTVNQPSETEVAEESVTVEETLETPATDTVPDEGEITSPLPIVTETVLEENSAEPSDTSSEETTSPEPLKPNTNTDGYFCSDNIEVFTQMLQKLKKTHSSVNDGFAWCWYPDSDTAESALGVCYSYNYMKLAAAGADFYAVGFENELVDRFQSVAHLLKYIDTSDNIKETAYARKVFAVDSWKELIGNWSDGCGVYASLYENDLQPNISDYTGELVYLDYSSGKGAVGWYSGYYCSDIELQNNEEIGCLKVSVHPESGGFAPADIGYVLKRPEPLLVGDALTFDLKCCDDNSSIYEIAVYINHAEGTLISKCVVVGGVRCELSADVGQYDSTTLVNSIRITVKRITGEGDFDLNLYSVKIKDNTDSSAILAQKLEDVRNYLRTDTGSYNESNRAGAFIAIALLTGVGILLLLWAYGNDRRKKNPIQGE